MRKNQIFIIIILLIGCSKQSRKLENTSAEKKDTKLLELSYILDKWSDSFVSKIDSNYKASIKFKLTGTTNQYNVNISNNSYQIDSLEKTNDSINFTFESTLNHYNKIYNEEITAMTSMGQAYPTDPIPLKPKAIKPITDNLINDFLFFTQRFFNNTPYDRVNLSLKHSRVVHGGHAIPIFYQKTKNIGVRSAWYQINKGEQVNEIGDTNPFSQYFIINEGNGFAKIGSDTIIVKANEAYFIPPNHDHVFWNENEKSLIMIFLAWGEGA